MVNKETLEHLNACEDGKNWFLRNIGELPVVKIKDIEGEYEGYIGWLRINFSPSKARETKIFDDKGNMVFYKDSLGVSQKRKFNDKGEVISYADSKGWKWEKIYNPEGKVLFYSDNTGASWTKTYDKKNRELSYTSSNGDSWIKEYSDNSILCKHHNGKESIEVFDNRGNKISYLDNSGFSWAKTFNAEGYLTSLTNSLGMHDAFIYNDNHQIIEHKQNGITVKRMTYDELGNVLVSSTGKGKDIVRTYKRTKECFTQTLNGRVEVKIFF